MSNAWRVQGQHFVFSWKIVELFDLCYIADYGYSTLLAIVDKILKGNLKSSGIATFIRILNITRIGCWYFFHC